jgi:hypothetical protein
MRTDYLIASPESVISSWAWRARLALSYGMCLATSSSRNCCWMVFVCAGTVLSTAFSSEFPLDGLVCRNDEERFSRLFSLPSFRSMVPCAGTTKNGSLDCFLFRVSARRSHVQERRKTVLSTAFRSEFLLDGPVQERQRTVLSNVLTLMSNSSTFLGLA